MALTLSTVKTYLKINDDKSDLLLNILIQGVQSDVKAICNITTIPDDLDFTMLKMIAYHFGNNGYLSETVGDISITYFTEYRSDIKNVLYRYRKITG